MNASDLFLAVHWTARLSALLFALALALPALSSVQGRRQRSQGLFLGFIAAHTVHFAFVIALTIETGGARMFPGGRNVADVGGLPAVFGIFAFFYLLVGLALLQRGARGKVAPRLRIAGRFSTVFIGFMFVSTYVPLVERSPWYALPAALVASAVVLDLLTD